MKNLTTMLAFALLLLAIPFAEISAGEKKTYTGSGRVFGSETSMTLGNGNIVKMLRSEGIATISTIPPSLLDMKCVGMGLLTTDNQYKGEYYCTLSENDADSLDIQGKEDTKGGTANVIGGSGKWKGATGGGDFKLVSTNNDLSTFTYKLTITIP